MKLNILPGFAGAQWVGAGIRAFYRRPLALAGLSFMFMALLSLLGVIPVIGLALSLALVPALTVGLMAATREVDAGRFPMPGVLFVALQRQPGNPRAMLVLGAMYAVATLLAVLLGAWVDGGRFLHAFTSAEPLGQDLMQDEQLLSSMSLVLLFYLPVSLAFWHAPALVHWYGVPPLKSLFFSVVAVLRNTRAFLVYGTLWVLLSSTIGLVMALLLQMTAVGGGDASFAAVLLVPISIILMAMFYASFWFTFKDSFQVEATDRESVAPTTRP